ncbi:MAG TPA: lysophospholipid acyltransferase family protein [Stellaceae bacterium]|nr:lysophospholipid acyltransferase family protein [Stellaceae bacterium]
MSLVRRIARAPRTRAALCWLVAVYIRLVWATSRWETRDRSIPEALWRDGRPFILAFWHGRLLMAPKCWVTDRPMNMLISGHSDGRIIAEAIRHFGLGTIVGSRSKGGLAALRLMVRALAAGDCVGVTPDGPRGPAMRASAGIIGVARLAKVPIVPVSFATSRRRILRSWDRFHLALPFSRGIFLWGEPLVVPADADATAQEAARSTLEQRLNALTAEADRWCGRQPVEPAPAQPSILRPAAS